MKIVQASGQSCNQYWIYSNYIAESLEKKEKFSIWIPDITFRYFPNLMNSGMITYPLFSKTLSKLIGHDRYIKLVNKLFLNKYSMFLTVKLFNNILGVDFRQANIGEKESLYRKKYDEDIKKLFMPEPQITIPVDNFFADIRNRFDVIVGVHIRYGDYRTYMNGKYFYTLPEYEMFLQTINNQLSGKKVAFVIATNENIELSALSKVTCFKVPESSSLKDLYSLSKCDYILGPPSSFSAWASQYHDVPIFFVKTPNESIDLNNFKPVREIWA